MALRTAVRVALSGVVAHLCVTFLCGAGANALAQPSAGDADQRLAEISSAVSAGEDARAMDLGTQYVRHHPGDARARVLLARVHIRRGDFDAAYTQLRRALRDDGRNVDALYYLGLVSARLAELQFQRLVELAPGSARVHQLNAESLEAQDRRAAAEAAYEAALEVDPDLLEALLGLAKLKRFRHACQEAIGLYERAERLRQTFDGAYGLGVCYGDVDRDEQAAARFEEAIRRDSGAAIAWAGLGSTLTRLARPLEAIARLQRAIELEPAMIEAHYALGFAYQAAGREEQAREAFTRARQLGSAASGAKSGPDPPAPTR